MVFFDFWVGDLLRWRFLRDLFTILNRFNRSFFRFLTYTNRFSIYIRFFICYRSDLVNIIKLVGSFELRPWGDISDLFGD